ncbi:hypothetical protein QO009_003050 [Brevibacillus aydinogluensis]|jgi:hypothetical protein|uniref:hypothetical protein n=1 Tax=Brevibacillus aydinogluensis TaxID=927786 RepID=UPI0028936EBE|nr:hypothetical protein [Brevibacillus aydinogluensis]MDT3417155.1 hypothetical protein [Brevibacillus aydinogluensis]
MSKRKKRDFDAKTPAERDDDILAAITGKSLSQVQMTNVMLRVDIKSGKILADSRKERYWTLRVAQ